MHEILRTIIAAFLAIVLLICCKTNSTITEEDYSETEFMVTNFDEDFDVIESPSDTISDPIPDEPEIPEEEPEEEPEPIPDTIFIWK